VTLAAELGALLSDPARASAGDSVRRLHAEDLSYHHPVLPDVVVFPETVAEVSAVLRHANEQRIPVVPFGAGTSLEGHVIPLHGGISLDLTRMNRIVALRPDDLIAVVQPGVMRSALNARAADHGLQFPVDPGADCTLGGMAATNASGTTAVRYGAMRPNVLGLEVVLADGSVIRTGGLAAKSSAGYGLTGLFVGSEGTLGVITEVTLRLHGIPEHEVAVRAVFPSEEAACRVAAALVAAGAALQRSELVDAHTVRAVNWAKGTAYDEAPTLFLELAGSRAAAEADLEFAHEVAEGEGLVAWTVERDAEARHRLWAVRHEAALSVGHMRPGTKMKGTDVCVPLSEIAGAVKMAREVAEAHGLTAALMGHVGDGNYHLVMCVDPDDPDDVARAEAANDEIVRYALARGGTCTGEHGVGMGKIGHLQEEHGDSLPVMRAIKGVLDPNGIMNPGKVLPG
jgi:D-lactate dehydrogenase (cytochrome)